MAWYTVRFAYEHDRQADGHATFGEMIVLFQADNDDLLVQKAEAYWTNCVLNNPQFKRHGSLAIFRVSGEEAPSDGLEIWCELSEGAVSAEEFFHERYERFAMQPEVPES